MYKLFNTILIILSRKCDINSVFIWFLSDFSIQMPRTIWYIFYELITIQLSLGLASKEIKR